MERAYPLIALLLLITATSSACLEVDLADRPCPCLDGFVCVNNVCVEPDDVPPGDDDDDAGVVGDDDDDVDSGVIDPPQGCVDDGDCNDSAPLCRQDGECVECEITDDCGPGLLCDVASGLCFSEPNAVCEPAFDLADACASAGFTSASLDDVCGDDRTVTTELLFRVGSLGTNCVLPNEFEHTLVDADLTGTALIANGSISVDVAGTLTFFVRVPPECFNDVNLQCDGDSCALGDGSFCECTFVVDGTRSIEGDSAGNEGVFFGNQGQIATCTELDTLTVREVAEAAGFFGPVMTFSGPPTPGNP